MGKTITSANGRFEWDEDKIRINAEPIEEKEYYEWRKNFIT
jgi:hypothetical protein